MNKKLFLVFIKDRLTIIIIFLLNTFVQILLFNVVPDIKVELLYPLLMSLFLLFLLLIIEWFKFHRFNVNLRYMEDDFSQDLQPYTAEQTEISLLKKAIYLKYLSKTNEIISLNNKKNYFLSQWIHRLKTPITVIDLVIQKHEDENKDGEEALEIIRKENINLCNSIEQVLTILRLDSFEKDYELERVNLVDIINELLNNNTNHLLLSNIHPVLKNDTAEMFVISDMKWNYIMIEQVISNAIKYSVKEGKLKNIYINITHCKDNTILSIRDEGIGIPSYDINRVFEPFFTGENGRIIRNSSGIGLFVCREIANKLGVEVALTSEPGNGTEVIFKYITVL